MAAPRVHALSFQILSECTTSKARTGKLVLPHHVVDTPVFMPVGTQGTLKGMIPDQLSEMDCQIMLGNTYHLGHRPGPELLDKASGLHQFMGWNRALLTVSIGEKTFIITAAVAGWTSKQVPTGLSVLNISDSGGFQMVSLLELAEITEEGVKFKSPHDGSDMMLTPEHSMSIQNSIGADIMMQLDDVVHSSVTGERLEEAMHRSIRWLDRCIEAHKNTDKQNLFAIVQGGLNKDLRTRCAEEMIKRDVPGFAVGGLSGGEAKADFWRMVTLSTDILPKTKPRYLMGVGFAVDLVVCVALGCDMFDCVFPTRTARFGTALVPWGQLKLKERKYEKDYNPIDADCKCLTCKNYTRAYLHTIATRESVSCSLLTTHNVAYQLNLMKGMRDSLKEDKFPVFVQTFFERMFPKKNYPVWAVEALDSVSIKLS